MSPIATEKEMSLDKMKDRVKRGYKCGVCGSPLTVAWGGSFGYNGYILRCGSNANHELMTDYKKPSKDYEEGDKLFRRLHGMDSKALMNMDKTAMLERIGQAKFPSSMTKADFAMLAEVSISYGLDPLMQELMIYQGNPYPTINARYRKAQESGRFDGINTRPATPEERKARHCEDGDLLYCAEVWVKGSSHPFIGWGRVTRKEIKKAIAQAQAHNRQEDALPLVKDPDRQCEKRAEAMGLRKAFSMPVPFQSWEEFEEKRAEETEETIAIEGVGKVGKKTGEIKDEAIETTATVIEDKVVEPEPEKEPTKTNGIETVGDLSDPDAAIQGEQLHHLSKITADAGTNLKTLMAYCNDTKGYNAKTFNDLRVWQYAEIIADYNKGLIKASK